MVPTTTVQTSRPCPEGLAAPEEPDHRRDEHEAGPNGRCTAEASRREHCARARPSGKADPPQNGLDERGEADPSARPDRLPGKDCHVVPLLSREAAGEAPHRVRRRLAAGMRIAAMMTVSSNGRSSTRTARLIHKPAYDLLDVGGQSRSEPSVRPMRVRSMPPPFWAARESRNRRGTGKTLRPPASSRVLSRVPRCPECDDGGMTGRSGVREAPAS
jgi:hypothetical protein